MSIERLCELVPPPKSPTYVPTIGDWNSLQGKLGTTFPEEFFRFCSTYGMGTFQGDETTGLSIYCPGYQGFVEIVRDECQRFRDARGDKKSKEFPFNVYPDEDGLLPFGGDDNDVWLCWMTIGEPDK